MKGNDVNAEESSNISSEIGEVDSFCEEVQVALDEIEKLVQALDKNNAEVVNQLKHDIVKIAKQYEVL